MPRTGLQSRLLENLTRHCGQLFSLHVTAACKVYDMARSTVHGSHVAHSAHICVRSQASMQSLQNRCMQADTARVFLMTPAQGE